MDTVSSTAWQRKGSSIIFDKQSMGTFISAGALVSLRTFLGWLDRLPAMPPASGKTILVSGLETLLETLSSSEADEFLAKRIRPIIIKVQDKWPNSSIIFGFTSHEKAFVETTLEEEVLFRRRDRTTIHLTEGLWDGSATAKMKRLVREESTGAEVLIGYHVARIS